MRRRNGWQKYLLLSAIILLISLGYAFLSANLTITGVTHIGNSERNVYFHNAVVTLLTLNGTATATNQAIPTIMAYDNQKVGYEFTLNQPGDTYEFSVDIVNDGSMDVGINELITKIKLDGASDAVTLTNSNMPEYLEYSVTYVDDSTIPDIHRLDAGDTETIKVHIKFKSNVTNEVYEAVQGKTIEFKLLLDYNQTSTASSYTVTFDANGGQVSTASKNVTYGSTYGTLPEPTREGYTFKGWHGKNLIKEINDDNFFIQHFQNRTTHEFINEDNFNYIRINGYPNGYADTYWAISSSLDKNSILAGNDYILSFYVRSENASLTQYIQCYTSSWTSKMGIYENNADISNIRYYSNENKEFLNDGQWHEILFRFHATSNIENPVFAIGNDAPNLNGENSYIDIAKIQLEVGNTETPYESYYITSSTEVVQSNNHTLTAMWEKKEATFITGAEFNEKIKQLAGDVDATYETEDGNIISIQRYNNIPSSSILSNSEELQDSSLSNTPIYAWYDSGTIYYYTEALNPYMNVNANQMFRRLRNVTSIDLFSIDTSKVMYMRGLFYDCNNLSSLNLINFDTHNVTTMLDMFANCTNLESLDLSKFNTTNVSNMNFMFYRNYKLNNLDLSYFDMSNVSTATYMLDEMTSLTRLKTPNTYPSDSSVSITLPITMYDSNNNAYTTLDSTSPTEIWLNDGS